MINGTMHKITVAALVPAELLGDSVVEVGLGAEVGVAVVEDPPIVVPGVGAAVVVVPDVGD